MALLLFLAFVVVYVLCGLGWSSFCIKFDLVSYESEYLTVKYINSPEDLPVVIFCWPCVMFDAMIRYSFKSLSFSKKNLYQWLGGK